MENIQIPSEKKESDVYDEDDYDDEEYDDDYEQETKKEHNTYDGHPKEKESVSKNIEKKVDSRERSETDDVQIEKVVGETNRRMDVETNKEDDFEKEDQYDENYDDEYDNEINRTPTVNLNGLDDDNTLTNEIDLNIHQTMNTLENSTVKRDDVVDDKMDSTTKIDIENNEINVTTTVSSELVKNNTVKYENIETFTEHSTEGNNIHDDLEHSVNFVNENITIHHPVVDETNEETDDEYDDDYEGETEPIKPAFESNFHNISTSTINYIDSNVQEYNNITVQEKIEDRKSTNVTYMVSNKDEYDDEYDEEEYDESEYGETDHNKTKDNELSTNKIYEDEKSVVHNNNNNNNSITTTESLPTTSSVDRIPIVSNETNDTNKNFNENYEDSYDDNVEYETDLKLISTSVKPHDDDMMTSETIAGRFNMTTRTNEIELTTDHTFTREKTNEYDYDDEYKEEDYGEAGKSNTQNLNSTLSTISKEVTTNNNSSEGFVNITTVTSDIDAQKPTEEDSTIVFEHSTTLKEETDTSTDKPIEESTLIKGHTVESFNMSSRIDQVETTTPCSSTTQKSDEYDYGEEYKEEDYDETQKANENLKSEGSCDKGFEADKEGNCLGRCLEIRKGIGVLFGSFVVCIAWFQSQSV